ncbi:hypothetical protein NDI37_27155 [Funiculus sociatus GB2-A5]|uniref:Uncharacterized protein n=1 Tax=Funiculus sociatus GB2-A5 TaxID=2933946 RepID=A0ABV0JXM1_9CYAN|nr:MULTISPECIES: hypothetical protein [unclassified Trichocoleus]MBD1906471.1 hypothetical protein [Trichocoleus sp. FACHB-832]MBD2061999.1 hypothetical protein [Trichocoleus sp. FACHB-6]
MRLEVKLFSPVFSGAFFISRSLAEPGNSFCVSEAAGTRLEAHPNNE